jgi:hypothetical protein
MSSQPDPVRPSEEQPGAEPRAPKAFLSYSRDNDAHNEWVKQLATQLTKDGVDVTLDQWHATPGDQLPAFMERAFRENDFVIAICTPRFKERSDGRGGGVGYEGDIMTAHAFMDGNDKKFIPVLRRGSWTEAAPTWLLGRFKIDLSQDPYFEKEYEELLRTLHGAREKPPPRGPRPNFGDKNKSAAPRLVKSNFPGGRPMPEPKWLRYVGSWLVTQLPLAAGLGWKWDQAKQNPVATSLLLAISGIVGIAGVFCVKVWKEREDDAVKGVANRLREFPSKAKDVRLRGWDWAGGKLARVLPGFRRRYLEELVQEYGLFNDRARGLINANRLVLERVYVDLRTASDVNLTRPNFNPFSRDVSGEHSLWTFLRSLRSGIALAVIGPPGSGKTTLMHHVLLTFARNRQRRYQLSSRLPLLLELRSVAPAVARKKSTTLGEAVEQYIKRSFPDLAEHARAGWFERQLLAGRCLVLLDGLDEVADPDKRMAVSHWVDEQVKREAYRRNQFVVTSRPQGYRSAPLERATVLEVQPFTPSQVERFINNWYLANEVVSSGGKETAEVRRRAGKEAKDLRDRIAGNPSLHDLTGNPLLLTMMAMVHRHGALPGSRVQLYSEVCQVLLERWRQAKGVKDELRGEQKLTILRPLANHLMTHRLREVSEADTLRVIAHPLDFLSVPTERHSDFLHSLQADSGLLLEKEQGVWQFAHLSFQEYLTAAHWRDAPPAADAWSSMVRDSWWRETILLYAAQNDASVIVDAALDAGDWAALALAFDCEEQALKLLPQTRERLKQRLHEALRSTDRAVFAPAAEAWLHRSQRQYVPIDTGRQIATTFVTQAEYQLFLNETRSDGDGRPLHWTGPRFSGDPQQPVVGILLEDASAYCRWLDARFRQWSHRLPSAEQAALKPMNNESVSEWIRTTDFAFRSAVPPGLKVEVTTWMNGLQQLSDTAVDETEIKLLRFFSENLNFYCLRTNDQIYLPTLSLETALGFALDLAFDPHLDSYFILDLDRVRAVTLERILDLARLFKSPRHWTEEIKSIYVNICNMGAFIALELALSHVKSPRSTPPVSHLDMDSTRRIMDELTQLSEEDTAFKPVLRMLVRTIQASDEFFARRKYRLFLAELLDILLTFHGSAPTTLQRVFGGKGWFSDSTFKLLNSQRLLLHVVLAREEGVLPAWEAIRVVRSPAAGSDR